MSSKVVSQEIPALIGHKYAFGLYRQGWWNLGMVADSNRNWWAKFWMTNADASGSGRHGQKAAKMAFLPFCVEGSNFVTDAQVESCSVETFG